VQHSIANELGKMDGIWLAVPSGDLAEGSVSDTPLSEAILRNYNAKRSGDIYVVLNPGSFINDFDGLTVASNHGSPWRFSGSELLRLLR
jgi:hypothetical protein